MREPANSEFPDVSLLNPGGETWLMLADGRRGSRDAVLLHSISQIGPQEPLRDSEALLPQTFSDEFV